MDRYTETTADLRFAICGQRFEVTKFFVRLQIRHTYRSRRPKIGSLLSTFGEFYYMISRLLLPSGMFLLVVSDSSLFAKFQTFLFHTFLNFLCILDTNTLVALEFPGREFLGEHFVHCMLAVFQK